MQPNSVRVLLVEDDEDDYLLISELVSRLRGSRFDIEWVDDYEAAIEAVSDRRHEVCLLDYRLGARNGLDFLREIIGDGCTMPVILLTGQADYAIDMEAMQLGAADYLVKGQIDSTILERSIRYAITHKRLEEQIREASRLASIGSLAAGVAHEINNPLTSVLGYIQLLMGEDLPESVIADLKSAYCEAKRAAKIVQNLLLFARKSEADKQYLDITSLLHQAVELKSADFNSHNIEVVDEVPPDLPHTIVDQQLLIQVLLNILANAEQECMAAHGGGQIAIRATSSRDRIRVSISDDGPGISPEDLNKIFEPFFTTKDVGKGTGLGLSICYGIIRQHGGELWAESVLGHGATFHIELPVVTPEGESDAPSMDVPVNQTSNKKLLVVDDEAHIRTLLGRSLHMQRYDVDLANGGEEGWRKLQSMVYDCVLLDLKMPDMSGRELYQLIEASDKNAAKKVIFITGDTANQVTRDFLANTDNLVVTKPFELEELHRHIFDVVEREEQP